MEIKIHKAVLHILDSLSALPVYSQHEMDMTEEYVRDFIVSHVKKIYSDDSNKNGFFNKDSMVEKEIEKIESNADSFLMSSQNIANRLYDIIKENAEIPSGDVLISLLSIDDVKYFAIIKFNYKKGYTHFIDYAENGINNRIMINKTALPSGNQKIDEGVLVGIVAKKLRVIEKKYNINGEKCNYFSDMFLRCGTDLSGKESIKILKNIAEDLSKKNNKDSFEKISNLNYALYENVEETGKIQVRAIAESSFHDDENLKEEYIEMVKSAGVKPEIKVSEHQAEHKFNKHKIKTDNGIELSIPMSIYRNRDKIEFVNNPDGTSSIILKNINQIMNK